jgi:group II intron reverse transcriptase/maturase
VDVDIKGFFDNINHGMLLQILKHHTQEKFVLLYVERWLKAGVEQTDGSIAARTKGTPQGGVISPILANLYLHHAFDKWMAQEHPQCPFERYADDIVIHCSSKEEAELMLEALRERMNKAELTLHPDKTKIVYCKNYQRPGNHDNESFTFLGYSFQPRTKPDKFGRKRTYLVFSAAISQEAKTEIREEIRKMNLPNGTMELLVWIARKLNARIRGWLNYYTKFNKWEALEVFYYFDKQIMACMQRIYRIKSENELHEIFKRFKKENPTLFYHWRFGTKNG